MDFMLHILGLCVDRHAHLDLLDMVFGGVLVSGTTITIKFYWSVLKFYITNKFKEKK